MDEPTTGVDPVTRQDFWQLLISLVSGNAGFPVHQLEVDPGVAVIISTPYMDEAARCSRVGFMRHGRIIVEDTPSRLRSRLDGRILELRGTPLRLLRQLSGTVGSVEAVQAFGDRLHLRVADGQAEAVIERLGRQIAQEGVTRNGCA